MRVCVRCGEVFDETADQAVRARAHFNARITECQDCVDPTGMFAPRSAPKSAPVPVHPVVEVAWDVLLADVVPARTETECRHVAAEIARIVEPFGFRAYYWDRVEAIIVEGAGRTIGIWDWQLRRIVRRRR